MAEIIDINPQLRTKRVAEMLAKDSVRLYCHPNDVQHFDWLPDGKVYTTATMEQGKPYAIDLKALKEMIQPDCIFMQFDYRR